jgi:hypothetical protein
MCPARRDTLQLSWILRIGAALEFLGHGALGISGVAAWSSYFAVVGIPKGTAMHLMPVIGVFDVTLALVVLLYPVRGIILYMAAWGLWTALLRPLAGESAWEAVERAGNYGVLFALFLMVRAGAWRSWLQFELADFDGRLRAKVGWTLRLTTVLLLAGHGALNAVVRKPAFMHQYGMLGLHGPWVQSAVGVIECALALAVLVRPGFGLLLLVVAWKLATEALSPMAGSPIWVFIEHGGSYAAPLGLAVLLRRREAVASVVSGRSPA